MRRMIQVLATIMSGTAGTVAWHAAAALAAMDPNTAKLNTIIGNLTAWIVGILAGIATLFLTIGGLRYLSAGGDPAEVDRAKSSIRSAMIGYALAILAPIIFGILKSIVG